MSKHHTFIETLEQLGEDLREKGLIHLTAEDRVLEHNSFYVQKKEVINFGSCSYLGLEFDSRMKEAAKKAIDDYGTQFSASRAYVSPRYYAELEYKLTEIFDAPTLVAPTTTLGHIATIPVLIRDEDAIILDHLVHNSVQNAVNLVKPRGVHVEMVRHNKMDMLEDRIKKLRQKHKRIWYMADGIYSMYGEAAPIDIIFELMDKYTELYFYVDDAHGMSCFGKHGRGYVLSKKPMHERMLMATSLNKAYASGGGVLVCPNKEMVVKIKSCGAPFLSSGPMQPAALGAACAAADIHLSDEIYQLQGELQENIKYTNLMLKKYNLPSVNENNSPVFFVAASLPKLGFNIIRRLLDEGFYTNIGVFPTVPMKNTGIRFTITRLHTFKQIEDMITAMAYHYSLALKEENFTLEQVYRAFRMPMPEEQKSDKVLQQLVSLTQLKVERFRSVEQINKEEWDGLLGHRGTFNSKGLQFLEEVFANNIFPENNWEFDYIIIRDVANKPIIATFFTAALSKDDMLSPGSISKQIEERRITDDPHYLCSKTLFMGSLLTEGNHLYLDKNHPQWKNAMQLLLNQIAQLAEKRQTTVTNLRDFDLEDSEMDSLMLDNGYFKIGVPENHVIEQLEWNNQEEFIKTLSARSKKHFKQDIRKYENKFEIKIHAKPTEEEVNYWYKLYLNVKHRNLDLNTFTLPFKVFQTMAEDKDWEILTLGIKAESGKEEDKKTAAVMFCYKNEKNYNFMLVGLDYEFQEYNAYRQAIYQVILRAKELGMEKVRLGYSASVEKRKFGAKVITPIAYVQAKDNYNFEVLGAMTVMKEVKTNNAVNTR